MTVVTILTRDGLLLRTASSIHVSSLFLFTVLCVFTMFLSRILALYPSLTLHLGGIHPSVSLKLLSLYPALALLDIVSYLCFLKRGENVVLSDGTDIRVG